MRILLSLVLSALMLVPAVAQEAEAAWRESVTGQIQALRDGDGAAALSFAGAAFRANYQSDPQKFIETWSAPAMGRSGNRVRTVSGYFANWRRVR